MNSRRYLMLLLLFVTGAFNALACRASEQFSPIERGDRFAYWTILNTRNLVQAMPSIVDDSLRKEIYVNAGASSQLAIMTLERSASKEAYRGLAYLALIKLDGTVSEAYECAVMGKGKAMLPYLEEARRSSLAGRCVAKSEYEVKVKPGVCMTAIEVRNNIDSLIKLIGNGQKC